MGPMRGAILAAILAISPLAARAGDAETLTRSLIHSLLPAGEFEIGIQDARHGENGGLEVPRLLIRNEDRETGIEGLSVALEADGIRLSADRLVSNPRRGAGMGLVTSGSILLSGAVASGAGANPICRFIRVLRGAEIGETMLGPTFLNTRNMRVFGAHSSSNGIRLRADPDGLSCRLAGRIDFSSSLFRVSTDDRVEVDTLSVEIDTPLDTATAQADPGDFLFRLQAAGVERVTRGEVPALGVSEISLEARSQARDAFGVAHILQRLVAGTQMHQDLTWRLEAWNALHILQPDIEARLEGLRLFLPAIVPAGLVANFRRAGVSNAHGNVRLDVSGMENYRLLRSRIDLLGVFDIHALAGIRTSSVHTEILRASRVGGITGVAMLDMFQMDRLEIEYQDTGADRVIREILGVPAGRLVEELRNLIDLDDARSAFLDRLSAGASFFLRLGQDGDPVRLRVTPRRQSAIVLPEQASAWISGVNPDRDLIVDMENPD